MVVCPAVQWPKGSGVQRVSLRLPLPPHDHMHDFGFEMELALTTGLHGLVDDEQAAKSTVVSRVAIVVLAFRSG